MLWSLRVMNNVVFPFFVFTRLQYNHSLTIRLFGKPLPFSLSFPVRLHNKHKSL